MIKVLTEPGLTAGFSWAPTGLCEDVSRQLEEPADSSTLGRVRLTPVPPQQYCTGEPMAGPSEAVMVTSDGKEAGAEQEGA